MTKIDLTTSPFETDATKQNTETAEQAIDELRRILYIPKIQEYYINLLKPNNGWKRLCAALDTLRDSQRAIEKYKHIKADDYVHGDNLLLYGLLNALYIQQDSIRTWGHSIREEINFKDYPDTLRVREIRDDICHASDRGMKSGVSKFQIFTIPLSYSQYYFEYLRFETSTSDQKTIRVDLEKCIEDQERDIKAIISLFIHKLMDSTAHFAKE